MSNPVFFKSSPDYHGVLCRAGDWRVAISPNGLRYLCQEMAQGSFFDVAARARLSSLVPVLPPDLAALLPVGLPDDPAEFDRPWVQAMAQASARLREEWRQYRALPAAKRKVAPRPAPK